MEVQVRLFDYQFEYETATNFELFFFFNINKFTQYTQYTCTVITVTTVSLTKLKEKVELWEEVKK